MKNRIEIFQKKFLLLFTTLVLLPCCGKVEEPVAKENKIIVTADPNEGVARDGTVSITRGTEVSFEEDIRILNNISIFVLIVKLFITVHNF